jgi:hypothetical protein
MITIEKGDKRPSGITAKLIDNLPTLLEGMKINRIESTFKVLDNLKVDLIADVQIGKVKTRLIFDIKSTGEPRFALMAIPTLESAARTIENSYPVFASTYLSERTRTILRERKIGYLDLAGNAYLRFGDVLIDRTSLETRVRERRGVKQLTAPKATRVLRALLNRYDTPQRITDLADACSMSPGGVYWVVQLLEKEGFAVRDPAKRVKLTKPGDLLEYWAKSWDMRKNDWTGYFSFEKTPEDLIRRVAEFGRKKKRRYAFTLMAGASLIAPFVRYQDVWMYIDDNETEWINGLNLKPVSGGGNLILVKPYDEGVFMDVQTVGDAYTVCNTQLYVDLYNFAGRGREQAEFLREQKIRFKEVE